MPQALQASSSEEVSKPEEAVSTSAEAVSPPEEIVSTPEPVESTVEVLSPPRRVHHTRTVAQPASADEEPNLARQEPTTAAAVAPSPAPRKIDRVKKLGQDAPPNPNEDELDSSSRLPTDVPIPVLPASTDAVGRIQVSGLDVDLLNVRQVQADRLVVSSLDTNTLQVRPHSHLIYGAILKRYLMRYLGVATDVHF